MLRRSTLLLRPTMLTHVHTTYRHPLPLHDRIRFGLRRFCGYSGPPGCCPGRNLPTNALSCPGPYLILDGLIKSICIKYTPHATANQVEMEALLPPTKDGRSDVGREPRGASYQ